MLQRLLKQVFSVDSEEEDDFGGAHSELRRVVKGQVLMGAGLLRSNFAINKDEENETTYGRSQIAFPVPTLTVQGELDGLFRISRA